MADELRTLGTRSSEVTGEENDFEEVESQEIQVKQMAQTIRHFRTTLPDQFKKSVACIIVAQRPHLPNTDALSLLGVAGDCVTGEHGGSTEATLLPEEDPEIWEKIRLLNLKISSNISAMPIILKRMSDLIFMFDRLDSLNGPILKRKQPSQPDSLNF